MASVSSGNWLRRQAKDIYARKAKADGYRARSAYKLLELDEKYRLMTPGGAVAECGAAPGAWTQVAAAAVNGQGFYAQHASHLPAGIVIGCDLLDMDPVNGAILFPKHDFTDPETQRKMIHALNPNSNDAGGSEAKFDNKGSRAKFDLVLSDMSPNVSGIRGLDSDGIIHLSYQVMRFAALHSRAGGHFVSKVFEGTGKAGLIKDAERFYDFVQMAKPKASRNDSSELYIVAKRFKGLKKN